MQDCTPVEPVEEVDLPDEEIYAMWDEAVAAEVRPSIGVVTFSSVGICARVDTGERAPVSALSVTNRWAKGLSRRKPAGPGRAVLV